MIGKKGEPEKKVSSFYRFRLTLKKRIQVFSGFGYFSKIRYRFYRGFGETEKRGSGFERIRVIWKKRIRVFFGCGLTGKKSVSGCGAG